MAALRPCGVLAHECLPLAAGHAGVRERLPACVLVCSWPTRSEECVRGTAGMCGGAARWSRAMRDRVGQR